MLPPALLCTKSSGLKVDYLTKEAQALKEEYEAQKSRVNYLMVVIEKKNRSLEKKRQELTQLTLAYNNAKQESAHVQKDLTDVNKHLRDLEKSIASIEQDILDGEKAQKRLYGHILEAEDTLKDTKECIKTCLKSLTEQTEYLESEKTLKLHNRNILRPQPLLQQAGPGVGRVIAATVVLVVAVAGVIAGWFMSLTECLCGMQYKKYVGKHLHMHCIYYNYYTNTIRALQVRHCSTFLFCAHMHKLLPAIHMHPIIRRRVLGKKT